jgi:septum formation protein
MNFKRPLILASKSPRRQYLMRELGFEFAVQKPYGDESFDANMECENVAAYLAKKKANSINQVSDEVVMTSDTIVILNNHILNKPENRAEAIGMLQQLSGKTHTVITAVCLKDNTKIICFQDRTEVTFKKLKDQEIELYVDNFKPFDKAGAYGAQDCLPKGKNPCSKEEMDFLTKMGKTDLAEKTFTDPTVGTGMLAIQEINGSYFNVMGLPIHKVYEQLEQF